MKRQTGFTLIELLIALAIFSVLSVLVASALHHTLFSYEKIKKNNRFLNALVITEKLMRADIAAIQPRPVVDVNGKHYSALFEDSPVSLSFTTATRYNPGALFDRSTLQRVRYALLNHELIRTTWATLDGYDDSNGLSEVLLTHIDHLVFNFVDAKGNRKDHWEMEALFSNTKLPAGILLDIDFSNKQTFHGDFSIFYQKEGVTY